MRGFSRGFWGVAGGLAAAGVMMSCVGSEAYAEVGPDLLLKPWGEGVTVETSNDVFGVWGNETEQGDELDLFYFASDGRGKLDGVLHPNVSVGYKFHALSIDSENENLPSGLTNAAMAVSYDAGMISDQWRLGYTFGLGTANDGDFNDSDSYYAIADVAGTWYMSQTKQFVFGVSFDGNRDVMPDVPLPFVQFNHYVSPELQYTLGFFNAVTWKPNEAFGVTVGTGLYPGGEVVGVSAKATWYATENVDVFVGFDRASEGFRYNDQKDRRLFFMYNKVELGTKIRVADRIDFNGGVGYAFNQKFEEGFDLRTTDTIAEAENHSFVSFSFDAKF